MVWRSENEGPHQKVELLFECAGMDSGIREWHINSVQFFSFFHSSLS